MQYIWWMWGCTHTFVSQLQVWHNMYSKPLNQGHLEYGESVLQSHVKLYTISTQMCPIPSKPLRRLHCTLQRLQLLKILNYIVPSVRRTHSPCSSANPFIGTLEVPVTNCSNRAFISLSKFSTACERGRGVYRRRERRKEGRKDRD